MKVRRRESISQNGCKLGECERRVLTYEWFVRGEVEEMGARWMDEWMGG